MNKKIVYNNFIKKTFAIVSGKGGVGKSFVTSLLAVELNRKGYSVGIIDADITGPSIANIFKVDKRAIAIENQISPNLTKTGIKLISIDFMLEDKNSPVVWRSALINSVIMQFYENVDWQDLDFLLIDMPPGTSDVPLTVFKNFKLDGLIFVTTPQEVVTNVVQKSLNMAKIMQKNIFAIVENMSYFTCDNCKKIHYIFGESKIDKIKEENNISNSIKIPLNSNFIDYIENKGIEKLEIEEIAFLAEKMIKIKQ